MSAPTIFGRQPDMKRCVPSHANPWYGTIIGGIVGKYGVEGGERFTAQQVHELRLLDVDPATAEAITVTRNVTWNEGWWPKGCPTPHFQFDCPVLARRRDGRISIISPSGLPETVDADGFAGRAPSPKKGRGK